MKNFILSVLAIFTLVQVRAQFNYTLSVQNQTYQPLTNGTSLNDTVIWDDELYTVPLGFTFNMDGKSMTQVFLADDNYVVSDTAGNVNVFFFTDMDLYDRGNVSGMVTQSPVRYELTGTAGNRILKMEIANAGIYEEDFIYGTNNDSVYIQVWLYEGSNIVEFRYGPSNISHYSDYFVNTGSPIFGYIKNISVSTTNLDVAYYFKGNYLAPNIDSTASLSGFSGGLNLYPPNGTVYRFTPKPVGVNSMVVGLEQISLAGNTVLNNVIINNSGNEYATYKIFSVNGTVVQNTGVITPGRNSVDISSLSAGMYMLQVSNNVGSRMFRINKR